MTLFFARRVVSLVVERKLNDEQLATELNCSTTSARKQYNVAKALTQAADIQNAIATLKRVANEQGTTPDELVRLYA